MFRKIYMIFQLRYLGFNESEATEIQQILFNVGICKLGKIKHGAGTGIDNLQSFVADGIYFTVEHRQLIYVGQGNSEVYRAQH